MAPNRVDRFLLCLLFFAVQATNLKIADIQVFEFVVALSIPYMLARIRGVFPKEAIILFLPILLFLFYASFYAYFVQDFFPPGNFGLLKKPLILSLVRLAQLSLILFAFVYVWSVLRRLESALWAMRAFILIAFLIAVPTVASFLIGKATGIMLPFVYDPSPYMPFDPMEMGRVKARGLFNEGGPYGLSLVCPFAMLYLLKSKALRIGFIVPATLAASFLAAQSKAGMACIFLLCLLYFLTALSFRRLAAIAVTAVIFITLVFTAEKSFMRGYSDYYYVVRNVANQALVVDPTDGNVAFGRVAGFIIGPRIFLNNVLVGTGLGNYSLVRNNPKYRGPLPPVKGWDLPGLGILTLLIEGGLLGLGVLLASYLAFFAVLQRRLRGVKGRFLFMAPLVIQAFGVQFYFAYHWIFLALVALFLLQLPAPRPAPEAETA